MMARKRSRRGGGRGAAAFIALAALVPAVASAGPAGWAEGLPPAAKVRATIRGADASDTASRQAAAFAVLRQVISELAGLNAWPPAATDRMREYDRESPERPTLGPGNPHTMSVEFQREVLSKVVSPATASAYEATSWFQDLLSRSTYKERQAAKEKDAQAQRAAVAAAAEAAIPPWVKADVGKAQAAHGDLSVFGLQLGRPLNLAPCADNSLGSAAARDLGVAGVARGPKETCVGDLRGDLLKVVRGAFGAPGGLEEGAAIKGSQQVSVALSDDRCPAWVSPCILSATVVGGVMVSAMLSLKPSAAAVTKAPAELKRKYGPADVSRRTQCTYPVGATAFASNGEVVNVPQGTKTIEGTSLSWSKAPGLYVAFAPYVGGGCYSRIDVGLATVHAAATAATARTEANEPKM